MWLRVDLNHSWARCENKFWCRTYVRTRSPEHAVQIESYKMCLTQSVNTSRLLGVPHSHFKWLAVEASSAPAWSRTREVHA
jgi:hypothetical protein